MTYAPAVRYPVPPNPVDLPEAFGATHETWEFRDSAAASLDACPDRMVPLTDFPAILGGSGYFSRVRIAAGPQDYLPWSSGATRVKYLGMPGSRNPERNTFLDSTGALPSDSSLPVRYGAAYAAGLGCVYLEIRSFETGMGRRLVGHVRGSDTLGTVGGTKPS